MPRMTEMTCACGCGRKKMVRTADVKRGWGKFFSKSCKAREQTRRTGKGKPKTKLTLDEMLFSSPLYRNLVNRERKRHIEMIDDDDEDEWNDHPCSSEALGQD